MIRAKADSSCIGMTGRGRWLNCSIKAESLFYCSSAYPPWERNIRIVNDSCSKMIGAKADSCFVGMIGSGNVAELW